jgi:hypothetical protein
VPPTLWARRLAAAVLIVAAVGAGCSSGSHGLGKGACRYLRPRLVRIDADRLHLASTPAAALTDLRGVAEDLALYVTTNLPDHGKGSADQPLVRFSQALTAFVAAGGTTGPALQSAETPVDHECSARGY